MNFKTELNDRVDYIEEIIGRYLPKEEGFQKNVIEAMNYSILSGGKRLRPMLVLETLRLFGGKEETAWPFMAAIEMIHTYSLVHDDLPAMDNDDYRRGRLTTHKRYGHAIGVLAGDGLLNYAFEVGTKAITEADDINLSAKALEILANRAGISGMLGGQTVDVEMTDKQVTREQLDFIYDLKTGALIQASMGMGAVLAGASEEEINIINEVALDIGRAFQIQDDILDVTSTTEVLGKPVLSDEKNNKMTYVTIYGVKEASEIVKKTTDGALMKLNKLGRQNEFLCELLTSLVYRNK